MWIWTFSDSGTSSPFAGVSSVPSLFKTGWKQAADHAPEEETLQEPDHPGLQDPGSRIHRHGRGTLPNKDGSVRKNVHL